MTLPSSPKPRIGVALFLLWLLLAVLAACSEEGEETPASTEESRDPVSLYPLPEFVEEPPVLVAPALGPEFLEEAPLPEMATPDVGTEEPDESGQNASGAQAPPLLEEYVVVLGADEQLTLPGLPGELRVWIGGTEFDADFPAHLIQDETTVPAVGDSARVAPFAPAFEIEPAQTQCIRIHPAGSEVRFQLTPQRAGTFDVGADVELFDSRDCSGAPVPKSAATLQIRVEVDRMAVAMGMASELWQVFWEKFLTFWGALFALLFGLLLYLIRGKLKERFGFGQGPDQE
ncbi:hypothetical protein [Halomonas sp. NO4]|uniref:hypothetical protein n=1 Tax=Halomonas sp. NO4 TaxID=2484813 RepID=UPI0013D27AE6|nr:hypothetical protein [Halomonas sp. NO4]